MQGLTEFLLREVFLEPKQRIPSKQDTREYDFFTEREHNERVIRLAEYLLKTNEFDTVHPFLKYNRNGICGEVDLLAEKENTQAWFEIKFRFTKSKLRKAITQYNNYLKAFPEFNGRAYCVCCDGIAIEISNPEIFRQ